MADVHMLGVPNVVELGSVTLFMVIAKKSHSSGSNTKLFLGTMEQGVSHEFRQATMWRQQRWEMWSRFMMTTWEFSRDLGVTNRGADGLVRSVQLSTCTGRTNRLIAKPYPLEIMATQTPPLNSGNVGQQATCTSESTRPIHQAAAVRGRKKTRLWTGTLCAPQRMSNIINCCYIN